MDDEILKNSFSFSATKTRATARFAKKYRVREALPLAMCVADVLASELADPFRQAYELNLRQSRGWNPQLVAVWNLAKGEHGINAKHCMESRTKENGEIQAIA